MLPSHTRWSAAANKHLHAHEGRSAAHLRGEKLFFNLHFNVLDESFADYKPTIMEHRPEWIPVTTFYKEGLASFLAERTRDQPDVQALYYPNFEKLQKLDAIRSYPYYMNEVTEPDIENVVEIFNG